MFYLTAVGGSSQYPSGQRGVVYVRRPGDADWGVLDQVMNKVSEYRICHSENAVKLVLVLIEVCNGVLILDCLL